MARSQIGYDNVEGRSELFDEVSLFVCVILIRYSICGPFVISDATRTIELGPDLSESAVNALLDDALGARHERLVDSWKQALAEMQSAKEEEIQYRSNEIREALDADIVRLQIHVRNQLVGAIAGTFP